MHICIYIYILKTSSRLIESNRLIWSGNKVCKLIVSGLCFKRSQFF